MSYSIIDEKLNIKACSIDDLSQDAKELFVKQFLGDSITTMTFFYNAKDDVVVLNEDNKDYELYKLLVTTYLEIHKDLRKQLKDEYGTRLAETFRLLDTVVRNREKLEEDRKAKEIRKILGSQKTEAYIEHIDTIKALKRIEPSDDYFSDYNMFMYGYIQGIRAERAKKKYKG